ncbi:uncharacterized protein C8Q71DRAFT_719790 [Rhodofomes roseus]|uniref:Uncharacterized protein n=1 Tax=Rhodofomes roseus TaxID=34475 RepID=A0ABQ8L0Z0_9APHY|nr:uncharacterized protein C8Q71DRAFT_719790 [Rhodofomes roseus]KAH9844222.1 hypothetical protein C8Q71DRAFT_719790 [Rhodofomes roseus]
MYLTFELQKNDQLPPNNVAPHLTNKCTTYEVEVEDSPRGRQGSRQGSERGSELVWTIQDEPIKPLTNGHIITLKSRGNVISSGRISVVTDITKHWVTMLLTGGPRRAKLRAPIPWCHLAKLDRFVHTTYYATLADHPPPHNTFTDRPSFANPHDNPYEFDLDPRETQGLQDKLRRTRRLAGILDITK